MNPSQEHIKDVAAVSVDEKDGVQSPSPPLLHGNRNEWQPGLRKKMPWFGITSLFFVILASIGQMLVLIFSNRRSAFDWPEYISPNVCLSILNGMASLAIAFAVVQGIAIAWWRQALLGTSIKKLHYTWNFSASMTSILFKFKYFNAIALAALMAKVAIVDGILFQRAIQTYIDISWQDPKSGDVGGDSLFAWAMDQFPITGVTGATNTTDGSLSQNYAAVVANWLSVGDGVNADAPALPTCVGIACLFGLNGTGFSVDCQTRNTTDNFVLNAGNATISTNKTIFDVDFKLVYPDGAKPYTWIEMTSTWPVDNEDGYKCPTIFTTSICELRPSIMNYTIFYVNASTIEKSKMSKDPRKLKINYDNWGQSGTQLTYSCATALEASWGATYYGSYHNSTNCGKYDQSLKQVKGVEVIQHIDLVDAWSPGTPSQLQGVLNTLKDSFKSQAVLVHTFGKWAISQDSVFPSTMSTSVPDDNTLCNYTYLDPRDTIVNRLNLLMSQVSTSRGLWPSNYSYKDNGDPIFNTRPLARQYFKDIYYSNDFIFMGVAIGLTFVVITCILPSYWGFWQLGRDVTLGPLEIAYAFQGPAFQSVHGVNGHADFVVKSVGQTRIQYGEIVDSEGKRLGFKVA